MQTIGDLVCHWAETHLAWGQRDPLRLTDDQIKFLKAFYATTEDGRRYLNHRAIYCRPKGFGKSPLGAVIAAAEAHGPVLPDGLDAAGLAVGRPRERAEVLMLATEEGQASNTYAPYCDLVTGGSLQGELGLDVGYTRTRSRDGTEVMPLSAGANSKDGRRTDFATFEETHLCYKPELRDLIETIRRNLAKRNGRSVELTTAWRPGQDSVAERSYGTHIAVLEGRSRDAGVYFAHQEGPQPADWEDDDEVRRCLAIAYKGCPWIDLDRLLMELRDPTGDRATFERYYLNRIVAASDAYIDPALWADQGGATAPARGEAVVLGFDGSWTDDATAIVAIGIESGTATLVGLWEALPGERDWQVDQREVDATLTAAFDRYQVEMLYADPPRWQDWVAAWQDRWGDRVRPWSTNRVRQMHAALERLRDAVATGQISHDDDPALARHVGNAVKRVTGAESYQVQKPPGRRSAKIDACVALALAWEARADIIAKGWSRRRSGRLVAF
jgi:phage terminase large subunit-like protein